MIEHKAIIYSVLARIWGNNQSNLRENGTLEENGTGHLADFDKEFFQYVKDLGCNYVWFIGLLEHSTTTDFEGIASDPSSIVKGKAGSPYAVKDYYDIAPYLSQEPSKRQKEFDALVERTHEAGLKFMMDFIPNHVARTYHSDVKGKGELDFGLSDDNTQYSASNNFYYISGEPLQIPNNSDNYTEYPARASGNDVFSAYPSINDWYETVKLNYGIDYQAGGKTYYEQVPDTWQKMYQILSYWLERGVDAFRCDMVELVPTPFWQWLISQLKSQYPEVKFLAEVYQKERYQEFLTAGFDYLYDKVGVYDSMRNVVCHREPAEAIHHQRQATEGYQEQMCYFLENHDEQRFNSDFFAGEGRSSLPALTSLALLGTNPFLLYFGGELQERGMDKEGFSGRDGRTSIFDYWALDKIQRLRKGHCTEQYLSQEESQSLQSYRQILRLANTEQAFTQGEYFGLNYAQGTTFSATRCLVYIRYYQNECILVVTNFSPKAEKLALQLPKEFFEISELRANSLLMQEDLITDKQMLTTLTANAPYHIEVEAEHIRLIKFQLIK